MTEEEVRLLVGTLLSQPRPQVNPREPMDRFLLRIMRVPDFRLSSGVYITSPRAISSNMQVQSHSAWSKTRPRTRKPRAMEHEWGRDYTAKNIPRLTSDAEFLGRVLGRVMRRGLGSQQWESERRRALSPADHDLLVRRNKLMLEHVMVQTAEAKRVAGPGEEQVRRFRDGQGQRGCVIVPGQRAR